MPTEAPHSGLMHDLANVRDSPVIWRLQTYSDLQAGSSNDEDNEKGYRVFLPPEKSAEQLFEQQIC